MILEVMKNVTRVHSGEKNRRRSQVIDDFQRYIEALREQVTTMQHQAHYVAAVLDDIQLRRTRMAARHRRFCLSQREGGADPPPQP